MTGTSVLGVKYKDGVMLAADMLGSYGSTKRYMDMQRIIRINDNCIVGASGEISDFQYLQVRLRSGVPSHGVGPSRPPLLSPPRLP